MIKTSPVTSSQIAEVGYDAERKTLAVRFKPTKKEIENADHSGQPEPLGSLYHYENVSPEEHHALLDAPSIGSHFYKHIKPNPAKYHYSKQA